ncbi:MAG: hypothetical protein ACK4PI_12955 [Tepidisphaerales bacterium]
MNRMSVLVSAVVGMGLASVAGASTVITAWNFEELPVGINNTPSPSVGAGSATQLGMTNSFTTPPSTAAADVLNQTGSTTPGRVWRIRAAGTGSGNGWHQSAPQYSQGAQFLVDTTTWENIVLTYDWQPTTQGVKHQQVQYTVDGSTWVNVGPVVVGPASEGWVNNITVDFGALGITAVNDNPLFGVRIVSAYAPDGPNAGLYVNLAGNPINNTSGNWRLDSITIRGTVIPEPAVLGVLALAPLALGRRRG